MGHGIHCALPLMSLALGRWLARDPRPDIQVMVSAEYMHDDLWAPVVTIGSERFVIDTWTMPGSPAFAADARTLCNDWMIGELLAAGRPDIAAAFEGV